MTAPGPLPEVRQCAITTDTFYGATAVKAGTFPNGTNRWGVMHPVNGGCWLTDAEVLGWKVMG